MSLGLMRPASTVNALVAGYFDYAAFGGEIALEDDEASGGLEGGGPGEDDLLAFRLFGERGLFVDGLARDGEGVVELAAVEETLGENARTAGVLVVLGDEFATGLEVADEGRALADLVEVFHGERDVELAGDGE
jgi:hypothetical protein